MSNGKSYVWSFVGRFGLQFIYLITNIVLARILLPSDFGTIGVLTVIFSMAQTLSEAGLGGALIMEKELNDRNCGTIFVFNAIVSLVLYVVLVVLAPFVENFYGVEGVAQVARFLGLVFVFHAIGVVPRSILTYRLKFKEISIIVICSVVIASVGSIILALLGAGVYALVSFQLLNALISSVLYVLLSRYRFRICFDKVCFSRMFNFGFFTTVTNVVDSFYENIITSVFGKLFNVSQAGYFSQAKKLEEASVQSMVLTVNTTAFPILSKLRDDKKSFVLEADRLKTRIPLLIAPFLIFIGIHSQMIIETLFGKEWANSSFYLPYLIIAGFFMICESINRNFIKSLGQVKSLFVFTIIKRVLGCLIIFCSCFFSVYHVLIGYIFSAAIGYFVNSIIYCKIVHTNPFVYIVNSIVSLYPLFLLFVCLYLINSIVLLTHIEVVLSVLIMIVYYFFIFIFLGIKISRIGK